MRPMIAAVLFAAVLTLSSAQISGGAPATTDRVPRLEILGARPATTEMCGSKVRGFAAKAGDGLSARIGASPAIGRAPVVLTVSRCVGGRWSKLRKIGAGRLTSARALSLPLPADLSGELRLRATVRIDRRALRSAPVYLRITPPRAPLDVPVTFRVKNVNRSAVSCSSDGREYTISGRLVGPASLAETGSKLTAVTLYLHEFSFGKFFWRFPEAEYDYATKQARAGHVSVIVDRLGYDESPGPDGDEICAGSQADMAHQMVSLLRGGDYGVEGIPAKPFDRVALAGHSIGGMIAEVEAYSFGGIDALILFAWADQGFSGEALGSATADQGATCLAGGEPAEPGGPGGYAYTARSREGFIKLVFFDADPRVVQRAADLRNRDPCGDAASQIAAITTNSNRIGALTLPVLLVYGTDDAIFEQPVAGENQKKAFSGSKDVTLRFVSRTGHAMTLERSAPETRELVSAWLAAKGF